MEESVAMNNCKESMKIRCHLMSTYMENGVRINHSSSKDNMCIVTMSCTRFWRVRECGNESLGSGTSGGCFCQNYQFAAKINSSVSATKGC